jgi:putrescine transport system permease protein
LRALLLLPVWAWLLLCVAAPGAILVMVALAAPADAVPPFVPGWHGEAFALALGDPLYRDALWGSLRIAGQTAGLALLLGYPMALAIARAPARRRPLLRALVVLPFLTGVLLRLVAWIGLLRDQGHANGLLMALGVVDAPLPLLHSEGAMLVGLVHVYLPFMELPIEARLSAADPALQAAAADLGASPWRAWWRVTLPLSLPGVVAGVVLVAVPVSGEVVVPALLGAPETLMLGRVIWDAFFQERDWPQAAALAVLLLALALVPARLVRA